MKTQISIQVGVVMGSRSDWDTMQHAVQILQHFGIAHEAKVVSAHRMPDDMFAYAESASSRGLVAIIADVATGTPLGICTMLCSESTPFKCLLATGTPKTGTVVFAASMPGRCAAPPAPAMMATKPRDDALSA